MHRPLFLSLLLCAACASDNHDPIPLLPLTEAPLATERSLRLAHTMQSLPDRAPSDPTMLRALLAEGRGETMAGLGEAIASHTVDGSPAPTPTSPGKLLVRFAHLADTQLADDESPARVVMFDTMSSTYASYRPQEGWGCLMLNAAVRTLNKVHESNPLEFVLLGGDNSDNAQTNEVDWFQSILDGAPRVECDSGADDDPVPGGNNDPKDPFIGIGLTVPWRWVTGNHDVLNQGNFPTSTRVDEYLANFSSLGTRDWAQPGAPTTNGPVVPDMRRQPLDRASLMAKVAADRDGHGITEADKAGGRAYYHFDVAGGAVRIVVMDTASESGGADGVLHRADLETYVRPALVEAEAQGKYVILVSHHGATTLTDGSDIGGVKQSDAVLTDEWRSFLGGFPHVLLHLGAHTHLFRVSAVTPPAVGTAATHAYFEAETDSLADWPGQVRLFEVWDYGNYIAVKAIPVDYSTENDPITAEARRRQALDYATGWVDPTVGPGADDARAVEMWFKKP